MPNPYVHPILHADFETGKLDEAGQMDHAPNGFALKYMYRARMRREFINMVRETHHA